MFNKKGLITAAVLVVATIAVVTAAAIVAGILFLRSSSDTVAMAGVTAVGIPNGPATTKNIGPAGGSIASTDSRITVTVPPNAVLGPLDFSIQPITNLAQGGMGSAYRLQPDGLKFATPIKVSFNFDAPDLKGITPEGLAVAYQDPVGVWQAFNSVDLDRERKTITISTAHFTDFSVWAVRLSPEKATLRVGQTLEIQLVACLENSSWLSRLRTRLGVQRCDSLTKSKDTHWSVDVGTITPAGPGFAVYQAPAVKPSKGAATVRFVFKQAGSSEADLKDVRSCEITIVGRGYRASGKIGDTVFSGDVCDLEKPFTIKSNNQFLTSFEFIPSSPTTGAWGYVYKNGVTGEGSGQYTIEDSGTGKTIVLNGSGTATVPVAGTQTSSGSFHIDLAPLDKECKP